VELPERLIAVAPRPNVEGVALCLNGITHRHASKQFYHAHEVSRS
jgi:hypothetical protein